MAKVKPLRAVIYNQEKVKDLSKVVCPPYDVISLARQQYYHDLDPYNFIHILLSKETPGENKYRRAASLFKEWLKNKILIQEEQPAVYFYSQQYRLRGEKRTRFGFIARLKLEDKKSIFGHEHTHREPKEDRLRLLKAVKANLSPIFVIFSDKKRIIQSIYQHHVQDKKPFICVVDDEKTTHSIWKLDSPEALNAIEKGLSGENIFIADGHHRYEVACSYRDEMRQRLGSTGEEEDFNYTLAYFTNTDMRGLTILPIHRFVKLGATFDVNAFLVSVMNYFVIEEVKNQTQFFFLMEKGGRTEHVLGMYYDNKYWLLRLKNIKILDKIIEDRPPEYRSLDVSILNYLILKGALGMDMNVGQEAGHFVFSPHADELIRKADKEGSCIVFFLNPVKIQQIMAVALNGNKMPPKSTYFYPKVLSGLVINKHTEK